MADAHSAASDVRILEEPLHPWSEIEDFQATYSNLGKTCGAMTVFVGTMRDRNEGDAVHSMHLEHYPAMAQAHLEELAAEAVKQHGLSAVLLRHRVGRLRPGEPIVLVAVWAAHRKAAYAGNRFLMEALKSTAPFWKQEELESGEQRWVECNTPG